MWLQSMKKGDLVVCIDAGIDTGHLEEHKFLIYNINLTLGKVYKILILDMKYPNRIWIINDNGYRDFYSLDRFKLLSEIRKEKLEKLEKL